MLDIDSVEALDGLLRELRAVGVDHQAVEAKASRTALPASVMDSVIAFANTDSGGLVLLGVDENGGRFDVVGVDNPGAAQDTFTAKCSQLDPPLRVAVYLVTHPDGVVLAARIPPVAHNQRPCHQESDPYGSSYIRAGDRDDLMTRQEVDDLLANRAGKDYSARPAPHNAQLDPALRAAFIARARTVTTRNEQLTDDELLRKYGAVTVDGTPTQAGLLTI
jgi:ATP-dependent DNA helicase RecG